MIKQIKYILLILLSLMLVRCDEDIESIENNETQTIVEENSIEETETTIKTEIEQESKVETEVESVETIVETPEETKIEAYPMEDAKKAIVTSMMNSIAEDIFLEDRQTIDVNKFHPYTDTDTEYALAITSDGNWKAVSSDTWRVKDMRLVSPKLKLAIKLNADVKFDGENYILSNGKKVSGNESMIDSDEDNLYTEEIKQTESSPYYVISKELIEGEREEVPEKEEPIIDHFEARRIFDKYGKQIYGNFKSHWIMDLMNEEYSNGKWYFKVGVTIKFNGEKIKAIADGIIDCTAETPKVVSFEVYEK